MKKNTLKKVLRFLRPYSVRLCLSALSAALSVMFSLYIPIVIGQMIDLMLGVGVTDLDGIVGKAFIGGICAAASSVCQWLYGALNNDVAFRVVKDIREKAFARIQRLPLSYMDGRSVGETVSRVISDVDSFSDGLLLGFTNLFSGVVTIIGTLAFMLAVRPSIAAVVALLTPLSFLIARYIAKRTYAFFREQSEARGEQTAIIEEYIGGIKVVKAFGRENKCISEFDESNDTLEKCSLKASFYSSLTNPTTRFVNSVVYAAVALTGALICVSTAGSVSPFTVGNLSSLLAYANKFAKPFNEISGVVTEFQSALACASRIFELIEQPAETPDADNAVVLTDVKGEVALDNVCFSYDARRKLIENLSLSVKPGQRIAIVGPTGCGKTTVINLLMRFYDVNSGSISVDGTDIRDITRSSLRSSYGMVLQETWLRSGTIRENICFGKPDAANDEVTAAAKAAHAHSFIRRLPQGYDTVISADGGSLSQGQKQLLCIARIILCLPPMLILDEATSSIDTRTELKIQNAFAGMMKGRTSFIVAHRLSTIREADVILVMRDGSVIEQGSHDALMKKGGFYASLYNSQFEV